MNRDGIYTVQAVSWADGTKHNVVVGIEGHSSRFRDWWRLVRSGEFEFSYRVRWGEYDSEDNLILSHIGFIRAVCSASSFSPTKIQLDLICEKYKYIEYSLEAFERFFIFKRERPYGFGVCVTVKV